MREATAFAPGHITGAFQIFDGSADALHAGSRGFGVSINLGARTTVKIKKTSENSLKIKINGHASASAHVSSHVVNMFLARFAETSSSQIIVEHDVQAPIGAGFGTSGAAALSLALALNEAFGLSMSKTEAAQLAHIAEVECRTGLGTVIAETFGGVEIRVKPGAPGIGEIRHLPVPKNILAACLVFGPLSTSKFLTNRETRARINKFGGEVVDELAKEPDIGNFMKLSRQFAEHVELITEKVRAVLNAADEVGVVCSMPMFGESVFSLTEEKNLQQILQVFRENGPGGQIVVGNVDHEGARLVQ
jgi:pantoate kinase